MEHLLADMARQGFRRFVISVGYLAEQVEAHFGQGSAWGYDISYVGEDEPLGTGGAVVRALPVLGETFILVNGDTLLEVDLGRLLRRHRGEADVQVTMAAAWVPDRGRYGALDLDQGRVTAFHEKRPDAGPGWINGGVMALDRGLLEGAPPAPFSLEAQWLPQFCGHIAAHEVRGFFVDMGTHETLATLDQELGEYLDGIKTSGL